MKWIKRIGYSLVVLFVVLNTMTIFHAWQFTHFYPDAPKIDLKALTVGQKVKILFFGYQFPKSKITAQPSAKFDKITLVSQEGLLISGWLSRNDSTPHAVILFHGHAGSKGSLVDQAAYFYKLGYSTLTIDFRAHGESDGKTCTVGFKEAEEVKLAFDLMKNEGFKDIVLYGTSMGAAAIIKARLDYQLQAKKLILEMPFGSLPDAVKGRLRIMGIPATPFSQLLTFWGGVEQGYWAFDFSPCNYATSINCPVLLQWGAEDVRVQRHEIQCIYDNIPAEKKLVVYEGAGHQALYKFNPAKWEEEIKTFLIN
jgi:pimeloyl-ACP methyl ester carboxylesterase